MNNLPVGDFFVSNGNSLVPFSKAPATVQAATSSAVGGGSFLSLDGSQKMAGALDMDSHKVANVATPTNDCDAANKGYVDSKAGGGLCALYLNTGFTPTSGQTNTWMVVDWGTEVSDANGWHSSEHPSRIVVPEAGTYEIGFELTHYCTYGGANYATVGVNGVFPYSTPALAFPNIYVAWANNGTTDTMAGAIGHRVLAANDYVELAVMCTHETAWLGDGKCRFWCKKVA